MALELAQENIWFDKWRVDDAEREFYENKSMVSGIGWNVIGVGRKVSYGATSIKFFVFELQMVFG